LFSVCLGFRRKIFGTKIDEFEADDDQEEQEEGEMERNRPAKKKVLSKSELYKAYAGKGPTRMVAEFLVSEPELKSHAVLITEISAPLESKYVADIKAQQDFQSMRRWNVLRSSGQSWWETGKEIVARSFSVDLSEKLGICPPLKPPVTFDPEQIWMVESWPLCLEHCFSLLVSPQNPLFSFR
jgi:hypothetical protein